VQMMLLILNYNGRMRLDIGIWASNATRLAVDNGRTGRGAENRCHLL
jgi:hypothetical protein